MTDVFRHSTCSWCRIGMACCDAGVSCGPFSGHTTFDTLRLPPQNTCSWSLTEFHAALVAVVRDGSDLLGAHPAYASLMERALVKAVLQHVAVLERLCHVRGLPSPPSELHLLLAPLADICTP